MQGRPLSMSALAYLETSSETDLAGLGPEREPNSVAENASGMVA